MAEAIKGRKSVRRVSEMISQIHPCSPIGTTIRNFPKTVTTSPEPEPSASGRKRKSFHTSENIDLDIYLDYYTTGKEFYEKLERRCQDLQAYPDLILSRIEDIVNNNNNNNNNLKVQTIPDTYRRTLSLTPAATFHTSARLLADTQESIQSEFERRRHLLHTSEECVATISELRSELRKLTQYRDSVNNILTPHNDPICLFRELTRFPD